MKEKVEKETEDKPKPKPERKIYLGRKVTAREILEEASVSLPAPIQPMKRGTGYLKLPPTFIATRFAKSPYMNGSVQMHFFDPKTGFKTYRDLDPKTELNVLRGKRGKELQDVWAKNVEENLGSLTRKVTCTIGTDPEIFVVDKKDRVVPAWKFLGSKTEPDRYASGDGYFKGTCYWDGFQAEFTTPGNLTCLAQMTDAVQAGLKRISKLAEGKGKLTLKSVVEVDPDFLVKEHKKHPEHIEFGCAPSINVYGLTGNTTEGRDCPYRFAGGHIHFGLAAQGKMDYPSIVRTLDNILGVACVSMFAEFDNRVRRQFYGLPGEHRLPAHGLEYRTLSNAWLAHPLITHMTFDLARAAVGLQLEGLASTWKSDEKETVETIMNHDVKAARGILARNKKVFCGVLKSIGGGYTGHEETAYRVWANGMESAVKDPAALYDNWALEGTWVSHTEGENKQFVRAVGILSKGKKV
jgi:hypothetical protein